MVVERARTIGRSEYQVTWQHRTVVADLRDAYQAPNRAHNFRTYFTPDGVRSVQRSGSASWEWGLNLTGFGYEGAIQPVTLAELSVDGNRVEYRRRELTEWYVNDDRGLEQGFTIATPPSGPFGSKGAGSLVLEMAVLGSLTPAMKGDGLAIELNTEGGAQVLRYGSLYAEDATGRLLPTELVLNPRGISLQVDDSSAVYPVIVDPLVTSPSSTAEGNQISAQFGYSVGTAGDVNGDGYSDVIVGAPFYDNGQTDEGRAFVYQGSATGLSATADWTGESDQAGARFGTSVGTAGDLDADGYADVIVGAPLYDNGESNEGRVYVYHGAAAGLSSAANWIAESNRAVSSFGWTAVTAGDVNGDGYADVIVGAPGYDDGGGSEGRTFVYHGSVEGLSTVPDWTTASGQLGAGFGRSVGTAGDVNGDGYSDVIVGAWLYDNGEPNEGRAFVFEGSATGLSAIAGWTAESDQEDAQFGHSVATAGDVNGDGYSDIIVGAYLYDNPEPSEGRAFVYRGSTSGLNVIPAWTAESNQGGGAELGYSVGTAGDVNGDGFSDVIVGAYNYDNGETNEGRAFVFEGSTTGLSTIADWTAESDQHNALLGFSVGTAGDVNGDGGSDVIVGAILYDNGEADEGAAFVYHGSAPPTATIPSVTFWGLIAMAGVLGALAHRGLGRKRDIRPTLR